MTNRIMFGGEPQAACVDCLFWLANGEAPEDPTFRERFAHMTEGCEVTLGMLAEHHSCTDAAGNIADDCECEQLGFSWQPCATCGSTLGGDREAVTFWQLAEVRELPRTRYYRAVKAGHKIRTGHELRGHLESRDGGQLWQLVRECCPPEEETSK